MLGDDILKKIKCFISYSHKDKTMCEKFLVHFKGLSRLVNTEDWYDGKIPPGGIIDDEIKENFNNSDVIFLLISPSYISSYYCYEKELNWAIERHAKKECIVIPVIIRSYMAGEYPFSKLKFVPTDGRPVEDFRPHDRGFVEAFNSIKKLLENFVSFKSTPVPIKSTNSDIEYVIIENGIDKPKKLTPELFQNVLLYNENLSHFVADVNILFHESIDRFRADYHVREIQSKKFIRYKADVEDFLLQICGYMQKHLIGYENSCIHFRVRNETLYKHFFAIGYEISKLSTEPIAAKKGMIECSKTTKKPIIKNNNIDLHLYSHPAETVKRNYLTSFFEVLNEKYDIDFSMCISIMENADEKYKDILTVMSIMRFDKIIDKYFNQYLNTCKQIDANYDIKKIFGYGV